jgi:5-methylcytosine-specific restriction endonuclease McrA
MCTRCLARNPAEGSTYCLLCIPASRIAGKKRDDKIRELVIKGYGGKCVCCGNPNTRLLQLDHINNDGASHRREVKITMNRWAYINNFPNTLQLLCANCHHAKTHHGQCLPTDHVYLVDSNQDSR